MQIKSSEPLEAEEKNNKQKTTSKTKKSQLTPY